jgi:hypothetical protein
MRGRRSSQASAAFLKKSSKKLLSSGLLLLNQHGPGVNKKIFAELGVPITERSEV